VAAKKPAPELELCALVLENDAKNLSEPQIYDCRVEHGRGVATTMQLEDAECTLVPQVKIVNVNGYPCSYGKSAQMHGGRDYQELERNVGPSQKLEVTRCSHEAHTALPPLHFVARSRPCAVPLPPLEQRPELLQPDGPLVHSEKPPKLPFAKPPKRLTALPRQQCEDMRRRAKSHTQEAAAVRKATDWVGRRPSSTPAQPRRRRLSPVRQPHTSRVYDIAC